MPELPRGTVTLLFTDIEGSTRLLTQLETAWTQGRALSLAEAVAYTREAVTEAAGAAPASSCP